MRDEFKGLRGMPLNEEQDGVLKALLGMASGLHCISGPPGSGKSFLIKVCECVGQYK